MELIRLDQLDSYENAKHIIFQFACIRRGSAQSDIDLEWKVARYFSSMLV